MKKRLIFLTVISLAMLVLTLVGQLFFPVTVNMILLTVYGILLILIADAAYGYRSEKKPEKEDDNVVEDKDQESYEHEMVTALEEKVRSKEEEIRTLERANSVLESQLSDEKKRADELMESIPDEKDALNSLLPPEDDDKKAGEIDIIKVCKAAVADLKKSAKKANLAINVHTTATELLVKASHERIKILFKNIIDNSVKYMNRQGSLTITISNIGTDIFIVLKDTGEGLPESETKHIFELNFQGSNRISGNGLGLAQARAIVEYYGGTIYAKSNVDQGMAIYIQLPSS